MEANRRSQNLFHFVKLTKRQEGVPLQLKATYIIQIKLNFYITLQCLLLCRIQGKGHYPWIDFHIFSETKNKQQMQCSET